VSVNANKTFNYVVSNYINCVFDLFFCLTNQLAKRYIKFILETVRVFTCSRFLTCEQFIYFLSRSNKLFKKYLFVFIRKEKQRIVTLFLLNFDFFSYKVQKQIINFRNANTIYLYFELKYRKLVFF
jgi:hypothetical protein